MAIVTIGKGGDGGPNFLDVLEDAAMNGLLLQCSVEAFGDTIGLRFGDEGEARGDTPEPDLVEKVIGRVLRAVIHAQCQTAAGIGAGGAEFGWSPWAIGCNAAKRLPVLTAWMPTQQASK